MTERLRRRNKFYFIGYVLHNVCMYNVNLYNKNIEQQIVVWFKKYPDTHTCMMYGKRTRQSPGSTHSCNVYGKSFKKFKIHCPPPPFPSPPHPSLSSSSFSTPNFPYFLMFFLLFPFNDILCTVVLC